MCKVISKNFHSTSDIDSSEFLSDSYNSGQTAVGSNLTSEGSK
jgi:hypothetical protein